MDDEDNIRPNPERTGNLFSKTARRGYWVLGHAQVVEDETGTKARRSHQLGVCHPTVKL